MKDYLKQLAIVFGFIIVLSYLILLLVSPFICAIEDYSAWYIAIAFIPFPFGVAYLHYYNNKDE